MSIIPDRSLVKTKRVQEMVLNGEEPPAAYFQPGGDFDSEIVSAGKSPIPVIDLSLLTPLAEGSIESAQELEKLRSALSSWGCFEAIGHGFTNSFVERVLKVGREFFELPMEEKKKYSKNVADIQGYGGNPVRKGQAPDWQDSFLLYMFPEEQRNYNFWPNYPTSFSEVMKEYCSKLRKLTEATSKAMAVSLSLEENSFMEQIGENQQAFATYNYYPPCPRPERILGFRPHTDSSAYTVLLQDEVGLQIRKDDKWFTVPLNPDSILILMGDQMEIMSNGIFKSPEHRVLSRPDKDRISLAVFFSPGKGNEIEPVDDLSTKEKPKLFKKVKDYVEYYFQDHDKKPIDLVRV